MLIHFDKIIPILIAKSNNRIENMILYTLLNNLKLLGIKSVNETSIITPLANPSDPIIMESLFFLEKNMIKAPNSVDNPAIEVRKKEIKLDILSPI